MTRTVTIPLEEYNELRDLKARYDTAVADATAEASSNMENWARGHFTREAIHGSEDFRALQAYSSWAYREIALLTRALDKAIWVGSKSRHYLELREPRDQCTDRAFSLISTGYLCYA